MSSSVKTRDSALNAIKQYMAKSTDDAFTMDAESIKSYMQLLSEQWTRFNSAQDAVEISCGCDNVDIEESVRTQAETWYSTALANFNRVQKCRAEAQPASVTTPVSAAIRLPKMELPNFSGDSTEWIGFFDAFSTLVDCNAALSNGQKLHYLRSCLRGDALKIISGFKICDVNYEEAWDLLKSRYKVMRVIVEGHFRAMANVKRAASDTVDAIKGVIDAFQQHIHELKALGRPVEFWDDWLEYELVNKLDFETRKQWELSLVTDEPPSFEQLSTFLEVRCRSLSMLSPSTVLVSAKGKTASVCKSTKVFHAVQDQNSTGCTFCNGPHKIYSCEKFRDLDANGKSKFVRESRVCMNCLSSGHYKAKCNSTSACRICHQRHHTLLHNTAATTNATTVAHFVNSASLRPFSPAADVMHQTNATVSSNNGPSTDIAAACTSSYLNANPNQPHPRERTVLLATALVKVRDCSGHWQPARLLFDSGSHASFVTESCVQRLGLPRRGSAILISGIGSSRGIRSRGEVLLSLSSHFSAQCFTVDALILPKITSDLPTQPLKVSAWPHIQDLLLADQHFMKPRRIDILVGMGVMGQLLCSEIRKGPPGTPMNQRTVFGWTLFGNVDGSKSTSLGLQSLHCEVHLDRALTRLWELEEAPKKAHLTYEERYCEELFEKTHRRSPDGRFIVELPLKSDVALGASRSYAVRSLLSIEKRLARDEDLRQRCNEFMQELLDMKHMELAPPSTDQTFCMLHHPVVKESSVTTKLRVVFNASAKTTTGNSLNDALFVGPQLQPIYAWTDSTITLAWLQAHPSKWITFVANRVADIQEVLPLECWNHIRSELNPADCASRGVALSELLYQKLWWSGPEFLKGPDHFWKLSPSQHTTQLGVRSKVVTHATSSDDHWPVFIHLFSLPIITNKPRINAPKRVGPPCCQEISEAELRLIRRKPIPLRSSILTLQPYLDGKNVLRVGGRIKNAEKAADVRHPIILPKNCPLAKLRVVTLKTPHGELVRPIVKLCPLPTKGDLFHEETTNSS
ncbi:uncharacterized protein LOC129251312 [Anastrepha obliqua]|uniref:uncharacterized protein LOC129251312 n=1 Tax=Anastrepha obliqua TaxID=95512 RepID=UPI0024091DED|nr:uncharacterized protein LOC129251312 [Anastrepha obliqua]